MTTSSLGGAHRLGDAVVPRVGYGAMQLAGPGVFGPPADRDGAVAVLRAAYDLGIRHIDTADFYGPVVTNELIREALSPYPDDLVIVTKVGARRDDAGAWLHSLDPADLVAQVQDNLRHLGVDELTVVNLRLGGGDDISAPVAGSIAEQWGALVDLQRQGLVRHLGLSVATVDQLEEARAEAPVACVQQLYNVADRRDEALLERTAELGIPYVPFFPLGGFTPLQSDVLSGVADRLGATPMQVALAWLLHRSPNVLLIPGTSSVAHLRENAAATMELPADALAELDGIGSPAGARQG
ncbi:MAG TPA: oxidoreductase [Acidimicrobiales bacterium]|nr:oxidoreductase [Acidimicrobiales bacterium]